MPAVRGDWPNHLRPGARKAYANEYNQLEAQYTNYFRVETSQKAFEDYLVSTGLGTLATKPEATTIAMDKPQDRGSVRLTHLTYGLGYEVSQELWEDDLYGVVVPPSSRFLAAAHRDGEEIVAASIFNNAFSSTQGYDGVALIDSSHPAVGVADQSNEPSAGIDMSVAALQAAMEHFMLLRDDRGLRVKLNPRRVIHHPTNFWVVREILQSDKKPFTANNEPNVVGQQGLMPSTWSYLTDTDAWFIQAEGHTFFFLWRRRPAMDDDYDKKDQVAFFFVTSRFSAGVVDWRHIYGSEGA